MKPIDEDRPPEGLVYHPDDIREHASAVLLSKDVADMLEREYPGWLWALSCEPEQGIFTIRSLRLSGEWGNILKIAWIQDDPSVRRRLVIAAGGEILERFGMRVGPYNYAMWAAGPRDLAGHPKPDLSDKHRRIQRFQRDQSFSNAVRNGEVQLRYQDSKRSDGTAHRRILIAGRANG